MYLLCVDGAMNDAMKQNIRAKVNSYLKRAEEIKNISKNGSNKKKAVPEGGNSKDNKDDDESGDPDRKRMMQKFEGQFNFFFRRYNYSFSFIGAIVTDPNVSFSDVIGLEQAKEALKEAVILPVKFPQLFQGILSTIIHLILLYLLFSRKTKTMGWNLTLWSEFFSSSFCLFSSIDFHFSLLVLENLI
jgi:vacuolar protein-sorting-associated protein 4